MRLTVIRQAVFQTESTTLIGELDAALKPGKVLLPEKARKTRLYEWARLPIGKQTKAARAYR